MSVIIRTMTIADYDGVSSLWLSIKGFAIRSIDDSREGVDVFLRGIRQQVLWLRTME